MKVKEVIAELKKYDQDMRVVFDGYEGGFSDVEKIKGINLRLNIHSDWFYGPHEEALYESEYDEVAVYIGKVKA